MVAKSKRNLYICTGNFEPANMKILYHAGVGLYTLAIRTAALFGNNKAALWVKGRSGLFQTMAEALKPGEKRIWMHCASLGEYEQGRPLFEEIRKRNPEFKLVLTFFSPSGYEIRKNDSLPHYIFYLPSDSPSHARKFLDLVMPEKVFFVKYEFWYFYLKELNKRKVDTYLISANFREDQIFFKKAGSWYRSLLMLFTHIFVQNERSERLLRSAGILHTSVSGDTRFDRVSKIAANTKSLPEVEAFAKGAWCIVAGSTWPPDEEILITYLNNSPFPIKAIIAPHEIYPQRIQKLKESFTIDTVCYSEREKPGFASARVLIIDNIGLLSSLYRYGKVALIGGGFGKGIHNTLEAATFGLPILFGPYYGKFQEAVDLTKIGGAFSINEYKGFAAKVNSYYEKPALQIEEGKKAGDYVSRHVGATEKIIAKTGL